MKFFTAVAAVLSLSTPLLAASIPDVAGLKSALGVRGVTLEARGECPSVQDIRDWLKGKVGDKTVFYTQPASNQDAKNYAQQVGGNYWGSVYNQGIMLDWLQICGPGPEQDKLTPRMAEALALESTGEAFVMMQRGAPLPPNTIWLNNEYPNLAGRVKVTAVNNQNVNEKFENWTPGSNW
ncbi:hypothetical protein F4802DRAFT_556802 [Xylaria palmicola]|nr:hypothetical protein F4802DRAFT_556802 [Xylaria palmicola]